MEWFLSLFLPLLLAAWFLVGLVHAGCARWRRRINARADLYPGSVRHRNALDTAGSLEQWRRLSAEEQAAADHAQVWADVNAAVWRASWDEAQLRVALLRRVQDHAERALPPAPPEASAAPISAEKER